MIILWNANIIHFASLNNTHIAAEAVTEINHQLIYIDDVLVGVSIVRMVSLQEVVYNWVLFG